MGGCSYLAIAFRGQSVARPLYDGLRRLQHRGQETAGISTFDGNNIYYKGGAGMVHEVLGRGDVETRKKLNKLKGAWGLASTRYRTSGGDKSAPPFMTDDPCLIVAAFNGNIINCDELWRELKKAGHYRENDCDLEPLMKTFGFELSNVMAPTEPLRNHHIYDAAASMMEKVEGSYSMVLLVAKGDRERLVAIRDPSANRPMVVGRSTRKERPGYIIASEDCLFDDLDFEAIRFPDGGEVNIIKWNLEHQSRKVI